MRALPGAWIKGGYPGVWFAERPEQILRGLVEALILRDASDRFRIQRPDALRRLLQLAAGQVGQLVNLAELASHLGISAPTVREYLGILEECWIVRLLPADWVLHHWRAKGGAEVDFVVVRGERRIAVEVKGSPREKLSPSARSFIEAYGPEAFLLATPRAKAAAEHRLGSTRVNVVPLADLGETLRCETQKESP